MPETQIAGCSSGDRILFKANVTQSVGVPSTDQCLASILRILSGRASVRLCEAPLISEDGATTYTSPISLNACSSFSNPSEWMPSSFVIRILVINKMNRLRVRGTEHEPQQLRSGFPDSVPLTP